MAVEQLAGQFPELEVSLSMGSASYPKDGRNPEQLMALADRRMYWHKRQFYSSRAEVSAGATA